MTYLARTLHFTFRGGSRHGNSVNSFVNREDVPRFEGDQAWFEMELVEAKPWSFWRAVRQVEPPAHARTLATAIAARRPSSAPTSRQRF